jgi:peroxiredoxin Q/BCP
MSVVNVGDEIPDFALLDESGNRVTRDSLLNGRPLVLFFYPKDESPICTAEVCAIRDAYEQFVDAGATVVGVSSDSVTSHRAFAEHHRLPFRLLSDSEGDLRRAFGVSRSLGLIPGRATYVVDKMGVVRHIFASQLDARKHVDEALEKLSALLE